MKTKHTKGFTLLETLVAISILSLSIAAAFGVAQSGLSSAIIARDQVIAFQLAQEAVEYVKNIRDTNTYEGQTWLAGIPNSCFSSDCEINSVSMLTSLYFNVCTNSCRMYKDAQGFYMQGAGGVISTNFKRVIRLTTIVPNQEVKVSVTMSWEKGLTSKSFTIDEHIFNWQEGL